jgi:hypothetical protein
VFPVRIPWNSIIFFPLFLSCFKVGTKFRVTKDAVEELLGKVVLEFERLRLQEQKQTASIAETDVRAVTAEEFIEKERARARPERRRHLDIHQMVSDLVLPKGKIC